MAENFMLNVSEGFDLDALANHLTETYRMKGFTVNAANLNNSVVLDFDKGVGGINMILGLGLGIKLTLTLKDNTLLVNFSDAEWTGKIIGLVAGWLICLVPFCTAIYGSIKQSQFPKELKNEITMFAS